MKRRKWWIVTLSLALLAACVGVWRWSERPPYGFLEGATLVSMTHMEGSAPIPYVILRYESAKPFGRIAAEAKAELPGLWNDGHIDSWPNVIDASALDGGSKNAVSETQTGRNGVTIFLGDPLSEDAKQDAETTADIEGKAYEPPTKRLKSGSACEIVIMRPETVFDRARVWLRALGRSGSP